MPESFSTAFIRGLCIISFEITDITGKTKAKPFSGIYIDIDPLHQLGQWHIHILDKSLALSYRSTPVAQKERWANAKSYFELAIPKMQ